MDYDQAGYEREIDLKELLFAVLYRWRLLLAGGVAAALLLGGYKAGSQWLQMRSQVAIDEAQTNYENYNREMEAVQQRISVCEREIRNIKEDIAKREKYLQNSVYINMSPYEIWEAKTELFVKTDYEIMPGMTYQNTDFTGTILQTYQSALNNAQFREELAKGSQIEAIYLKELIGVDIGWNNNGYNHLLIIQVRHPEEEMARSLMKKLLEGVDRSRDSIRSSIKDHTITEVSSSLGCVVDLDLAERQRNEKDSLERFRDSLAQKELELLNLGTEKEGLKKPEQISETAVVKSGVKYGLIGVVLGIFGAAFFAAVGFVMSDKVSSARELKYRFKIRILGRLPLKSPKAVHRFDAFLRKLEGRPAEAQEGREYDLIAMNLLNCGKKPDSLFVTGGASDALIACVAENLSKRLEEIPVHSGGSLLKEPESLKKLSESGSVVLVEQRGISSYDTVEMELEKIADVHKELVGCVVFE